VFFSRILHNRQEKRRLYDPEGVEHTVNPRSRVICGLTQRGS
jgi:hypothetical protein